MELLNRVDALKQKNVKITCVVPVHNEREVIEDFLRKLQAFLQQRTQHWHIIVVDDGSRDGSAEILEKLAHEKIIHLVTLSRNFGKEIALTAGIDCCDSDVTILLDGDFQHPIEMIDSFLQHWSEGYDMVYGVRTNRDNESWIKRFFTQIFYRMMMRFTEINIPQNAGDFRLMDYRVVHALQTFEERNRFMKGLYAWVGFKSLGIPYEVQDRAGGTSSWHFTRLTQLAITGITSFSDAPLRLSSLVGVLISVLSFFCAIYIVVKTLLTGVDIPGYATLLTAITFLGGIQLLSIGILGEYIARIFNEVKKRPKYLVAKTHGFKQAQDAHDHQTPFQ